MAGIETDFIGTARPAPGITIGYLPQEPMLDPTRNVRGNVELAVAPLRAHLARFDEINARLGEGPDADEMDALLDEQARVQDAIEAAAGVGPRPPRRDRHGRHAASPRRGRRRHALRRRTQAGRSLQDPARAPRPPAPGRADQPPRRRERRLARTAPAGVSRHGRDRHPRPLLPRQRRQVDPRARPRPGHPLGRQLLVLARAEASAPGARGEAGELAAQAARPRARVGPHVAAGPRCQEPGTAPALRADGQPGRRAPRRGHRAPDPPRAAPGHARRRGAGCSPRATATTSCSKR